MAGVTVLPVKTFTREQPCTKVDIHNCFYRDGTYTKIPAVEARGHIGLNTPKYLKREGFMYELVQGGIDYWHLSMPGEEWLEAGLKRHLELHPEDMDKVDRRTTKAPAARKRIVRTR